MAIFLSGSKAQERIR